MARAIALRPDFSAAELRRPVWRSKDAARARSAGTGSDLRRRHTLGSGAAWQRHRADQKNLGEPDVAAPAVGDRARFLNRQLWLPVSTMSQ
jgi:hypothetical protein